MIWVQRLAGVECYVVWLLWHATIGECLPPQQMPAQNARRRRSNTPTNNTNNNNNSHNNTNTDNANKHHPHNRQKATNDAGYGLRIAETNSAINGGRKGLSEVFGAALWTADVTLEFARAGALGVHMHWGVGGDPLNGGPAYVGVQTNYMKGNPEQTWPSVHAPWYGYLLYNEATKGENVRFTYNERLPGATCSSAVKVWSLVGGAAASGAGAPAENAMPDRTLRVVIINKHQTRGCNVELRLPAGAARSHAELHWLKTDAGVGSVYGVTWRGQTYQGTMDGRMVGERDIVNLRPSSAPGSAPVFKVPVPAGQAVLLVTSGDAKGAQEALVG